MNRKALMLMVILMIPALACQALAPILNPTQEPHVEDPSATMLPDTNFPDRDALPNSSGIDGVQTFPDKSYYHNHIEALEEPGSDIPPAFGAHYSAWQNCGIYDQPVELGHALHSLEHGAVWLTYASNLPSDQVEYLRSLVRGKDFVLMSPYSQQTKPAVLTAWTIQLVIDSLPDERIEKFIDYYANGPQNLEPGAPCDGAIGFPIE